MVKVGGLEDGLLMIFWCLLALEYFFSAFPLCEEGLMRVAGIVSPLCALPGTFPFGLPWKGKGGFLNSTPTRSYLSFTFITTYLCIVYPIIA
jgi:hypothetical protein